MAKRWEHLKGKVDKFQQEPEWQKKINVLKQGELLGQSKVELALEYDRVKARKDALNEELSDLNTRLEAVNQLMEDLLDDEGISKFEVEGGNTYYLRVEPYCQLADKDSFVAWLKENQMEAMLTIYHTSLNAMVKDALSEGKLPPPGVKMFLKTTLQRRTT